MKGPKKQKWQMIKEQCIQQYITFQKWDALHKYNIFHSSHYDWWTFPIDQPSTYRDKYQIGPIQQEMLIKDKAFMQALRGNAILVCKAWGYDLIKGRQLTERTSHQKWQRWSIRLYKMANSLELFGEQKLHKNAVLYGLSIMNKGQHFHWSGKDLEGYFRSRGQTIYEEKGKSQQKKEIKGQLYYRDEKKEYETETEKKEVQQYMGPQSKKVEQTQRFKSMGKPSITPSTRNPIKPRPKY